MRRTKSDVTPRFKSRAGVFWTIRSCFLLTLTFLSFYSLLLYFNVLAARALSLAPREEWTLINLSRAFRAQDGVESAPREDWTLIYLSRAFRSQDGVESGVESF